MKRKWIKLAMLFGICAETVAAYNGRVFVDANHNGRFDKGEKLISKVSVSDGLNVVQTDAAGHFSLPGHENARFVFITVPSGFRAPAYFQRINEVQQSYDFALQVQPTGLVAKDGTHRFIHISDTHMDPTMRSGNDGHALASKALRDYAQNEHVAFLIHTGDITRDDFESYQQFFNTENMPTAQAFFCVGNHDLGRGSYGEEGFEEFFGPTYYSFDIGNIHYIVTPMEHGDGRPTYSRESIGEWLKNDLKYVPENRPVIAFNHSVMSGDGHFRFGSKEKGYIDLADYNLKAWLYGHWHHHRMYRPDNSDVLMVCSPGHVRGSYDHSPSSYRVLTVDGKGSLSSEIRYPYQDCSLRIASVDNGRAVVAADGTVVLSVNTYSSVAHTVKVTYGYSAGGKELAKGLPMKQQTDFNWNAQMKLPQSLAGQLVTVSVTAEFGNGEVSKEMQTFRYDPKQQFTVSTGEDWTNLLQNAAHGPVVKDTLHLPLQLAWVQNIGSNILFTAPLIYQGRVYAASMDDNFKGKAAVVCMDAQTGEIKWKKSVRHSVRSSIAATDGCILAQDINGWAYSFDAVSGQLLWEKDLKMGKQVPLDNGILADNGTVYAGTGKWMYALEAKTGKEIWQNTSWGTDHGTVSTFSLLGDKLICPAYWEGLYALDAKTGRRIWARSYGFGGPITQYGNVLYVVNNNTLSVVDPGNGETIMKKTYDFSLHNVSAPLVTEKEIFLGTGTTGVISIDKETLDVKWRFETGRAMIYTAAMQKDPAQVVEASPVLVGNTVFIGAADGYLYALDRKKGIMQWKHAMGSPVLSTVAISGNNLVAVDFSGNVYSFVAGK